MSAAERAKRVVARRTGNTLAGDLAVTALMADPALLVDLAIEAGGLVRLSDRFGWKPDPNFAGCAIVNVDGAAARDDAWLPLFRRVDR